jgi:hypothetical protein
VGHLSEVVVAFITEEVQVAGVEVDIRMFPEIYPTEEKDL